MDPHPSHPHPVPIWDQAEGGEEIPPSTLPRFLRAFHWEAAAEDTTGSVFGFYSITGALFSVCFFLVM